MVSSIDGRLLVDRWTPPAAGIDPDIVSRHYDEVAARFHADGWIVGSKTMEHFVKGAARTPKAVGGGLRDTHIEEISLLVYPGIDGLAGVPSIFEFVGDADERPAAGQSLRHIATETLDGGMVWLRYGVEKEPSRSI